MHDPIFSARITPPHKMGADLKRIHDRQKERHKDTIRRLTRHLKELVRFRPGGIVTSDDCVRFMEKYGIEGDKRLIGALFVHGPFVRHGYAPSSYRRGMHATWKIKTL